MRTKARFTNMLAAATVSVGTLLLWVSMTGAVDAEPALEPMQRGDVGTLMARQADCRPKPMRCRSFACDAAGVERG